MKVLFITRKYPPATGGMETLSYNITIRYPGEKKILKMGKKNQMHLIWFIPLCMFYLMINSKKYKVLHLSDMVLILLGAWVRIFNKKIKIMINIHGLDINFSDRKSILSKIYKIYLNIFAKEKNYDKLICNSNNTQEIAQSFNFAKTEVIPIGIEYKKTANYSKEDLYEIISNKHKNKKYLLTVGRLVERKGVKWFIENVLAGLPEDVVYLVVGEPAWIKSGENELDKIKKSISNRNLQNQVQLLGRVSGHDLEVLYQTADIFLMPNIPVVGDAEGFGIVAIEASARGLPVVASELEGITEAIKQGENGFLIKPKDSGAFVNKINELINYSDIDGLKKEISDYTIKEYSWDNIINKYKQVFNSKY